MKKKYAALFAFLGIGNSIAQSLGRAGNDNDIVTTPTAGKVLIGGGSVVDAAFTWMINKSAGGDPVGGCIRISNKEQGISNNEILQLRHSIFRVPCSLFKTHYKNKKITSFRTMHEIITT